MSEKRRIQLFSLADRIVTRETDLSAIRDGAEPDVLLERPPRLETETSDCRPLSSGPPEHESGDRPETGPSQSRVGQSSLGLPAD